MSDSEDQGHPLPRIVKSTLRPVVSRQELLDNPSRRQAATKSAIEGARLGNTNRAKAAIKTSIGGEVVDNPHRARVPVIKSTPVSGAAYHPPGHPPRTKAAIKPPIGGTNNSSSVKAAAKTPVGGDTRPIDQELDEKPVTRDHSRSGQLHILPCCKSWHQRFP